MKNYSEIIKKRTKTRNKWKLILSMLQTDMIRCLEYKNIHSCALEGGDIERKIITFRCLFEQAVNATRKIKEIREEILLLRKENRDEYNKIRRIRKIESDPITVTIAFNGPVETMYLKDGSFIVHGNITNIATKG